MKIYTAFILVIFIPSLSFASEWPADLVQKTYQGCVKKGGQSQCECLVGRLQHKFTFEDVRLAMQNKQANQAFRQAMQTYNVKCLDADYKKQTKRLINKQ